MIINTNVREDFWQPETNSFVCELSDILDFNVTYHYDDYSWYCNELCSESIVFLRNPETKTMVIFNHVKTLTDSSGEDIYGWNYKSDCGEINLLIINN